MAFFSLESKWAGKFTKKAKEELFELKKINNSTQTLKFFVEAQPQLFIESLSILQVYRS